MNVGSKHELASSRSSSLLRRGSFTGEPLGNPTAASKCAAQGQTVIVNPAQLLLQDLMREKLLLPDDLDSLNEDQLTVLYRKAEREQILAQLVEFGLLTPYQAERIESGKLHGLVLGNYRVLDRIGSGGMGTVYKAEHIQLRQLAAVKVVAIHTERGDWQRLLMRFRSEIRAVAQLRHPNIVQALDAGEIPPPDSESPALCYYVMEFVQGQDLETLVSQQGPLPIGQACEIVYQVASALHEIHCHRLVHRDIKPSNIILTAEGKAKLLDFGLVRHLRHRVTEVGTVLGTIDYMAPEQASDASSVDIRADIYSLGGTLFWCLTGRQPFPSQGIWQKIY
jgi:serine/threonine protein kinase